MTEEHVVVESGNSPIKPLVSPSVRAALPGTVAESSHDSAVPPDPVLQSYRLLYYLNPSLQRVEVNAYVNPQLN